MGRVGKKYKNAKAQMENRAYKLDDALPLVKKLAHAKFDELVKEVERQLKQQ